MVHKYIFENTLYPSQDISIAVNIRDIFQRTNLQISQRTEGQQVLETAGDTSKILCN